MVLSPYEKLAKAVKSISPTTALSRFQNTDVAVVPAEGKYRVDGFGANEFFYKKVEPFLDFLFEDYLRVEMAGLKNLPTEGPALLVANHAGALPLDALMIKFGIRKKHSAHRDVRCLLEDIYMRAPYLSPILTSLGMVRAHRENATRLLSTGHLVGVFPEGHRGALKSYKKRYQLQRFGRGGFVKLAYEADVPIIPCAIIGSEESYPMINNMQWFTRRLGLNMLPVTLTFPALGPLGFLPLPAKWTIRFEAPIDTHEFIDSTEDDIAVHRLKEQVRSKIQWMIHDLLSRRESVWMG